MSIMGGDVISVSQDDNAAACICGCSYAISNVWRCLVSPARTLLVHARPNSMQPGEADEAALLGVFLLPFTRQG